MDVNLPRDKATGKQRGFGFLMYEDQRSTVLAVDNLNGAQVLGRTLRVDHVQNYKQPKLKGEDGELQESTEQSLNAKPLLVRGASFLFIVLTIPILSPCFDKQTRWKSRMMVPSLQCHQLTQRILWLATYYKSEEKRRLFPKPKTRGSLNENTTERTRRLKNDEHGKSASGPSGRPRRKSGDLIRVTGRRPLETEMATWTAVGTARANVVIRYEWVRRILYRR